jgi:hypothetical protein
LDVSPEVKLDRYPGNKKFTFYPLAVQAPPFQGSLIAHRAMTCRFYTSAIDYTGKMGPAARELSARGFAIAEGLCIKPSWSSDYQ